MNANVSIENKKVSVLLVNYKTRRLTELCLSLIKEKFDLQQMQIIVIDNNSRDDSLSYLRSVDWIQLIERTEGIPEQGHLAHSSALDIGMQAVTSKFVLLMHTDTLIKNSLILDLLMEQMQNGKAVCAGSVDQRNRKLLSRTWRSNKRLIRHFLGRESRRTDTIGSRHSDSYIKSFCSLWDASVIRRLNLKFCAADRNPGYEMQDQMLNLGHKLKIINPQKIFQYISHVQGGTHAELGVHKKDHRRSICYQKLLSEYSAEKIEQPVKSSDYSTSQVCPLCNKSSIDPLAARTEINCCCESSTKEAFSSR